MGFSRERLVSEREHAIAALLECQPFRGDMLQVELRAQPDAVDLFGGRPTPTPPVTVLWQGEVPLAARFRSVVVLKRGAAPGMGVQITRLARARDLAVDTTSEDRLWRLLGLPPLAARKRSASD